ncbi:MAG: bifunctional pyr operon transcriptional regulator/uracil phosphoribosyltransferase PyrR [Oscillospiraceae bacterium]|nr:bifunctional pyr operon transcriptional regulator/uracil phosphoribosyltransferase PyrR [Clostridiaceae bacterium]MDO4495103.1 bifunctional pyr operon transcriptional regulator/uracil phosphoribosyltransferase PyrR [Clostridiaceae bacterium]MDY5948412.1 bifunctional pyr operon transcriptional regulator/uracil phosphoribosyltransferase PyrR [Oscillospiraceae bacterium]
MEFKSTIMDSGAVNRALARISHEIIERNCDSGDICLVGIMRRGAPLADILAAKIKSLGIETEIGYLDITLYRDDLTESVDRPKLKDTKIEFSVTGKTVIMVDDVLFTGRTARAAMDAIMSLGRPAKIQFAALIDRGHRELPIVADYIGKNVPTSSNEVIVVNIPPFEKDVSVSIWQK